MPVRRFVVVVLPTRDTRLGTLAADTGCRIQLLARRAPGPAYDVEFEANAIPPAAAHRAAHELAGLAQFWYSLIGAEEMVWRAAARVPVDNIASRTCRALTGVSLDAGWAWMVLEGPFAQLRLLPAPGVPVQAFAEEIEAALGQHGAPWDMYLADLESAWYDQARAQPHAPLVA